MSINVIKINNDIAVVKMEELIIKRLTDHLTPAEETRFRDRLMTDKEFMREYRLMLAALALADYSVTPAEEDISVNIHEQ